MKLYAKININYSANIISFVDSANTEYVYSGTMSYKEIKDLKWAHKQGRCASITVIGMSQFSFGTASMEKYNTIPTSLAPYSKYFTQVNIKSTNNQPKQTTMTPQNATVSFIHTDAMRAKPERLKMQDLKWKYLVRSVLKAKNIMMVGPSGTGKTQAAQSLSAVFPERPYMYFNLGATTDPRGALIGNTHFKKDEGTCFSESPFVKAIQTPNAIILLDELSRAHPEAFNILMTVLDSSQRYLRLDESEGSPIIKVAEGVSFIATANVGAEYTSTRVLDRALLDRFVIIEMDTLEKQDEIDLLQMLYPNLGLPQMTAIANIACATRTEVKSAAPAINTIISTRMTIELAGLLDDGFTLEEAAEVAIYPFYDSAGGTDSERTYVAQIVQKNRIVDVSNADIFNTTTDEVEDNLDIENTPPF